MISIEREQKLSFLLSAVREKGLEPSRLYRHKILSLACLPIPAFPQVIRFSNQGDNQI